MPQPAVTISIVIPAFNRLGPLRATLLNALQAIAALGEAAEVILVDDGSEPPLARVLTSEELPSGVRLVRQANQGSIVARMTGLQEAQGEFILFLDSDDLIAPEKLRAHVTALRAREAEISYDDLGGAAAEQLQPVERIEELVLRVQPAPHGPIYRRSYLQRALAAPLLPAMRSYDPVGDIWLFYNLCTVPARIVKVDGAFTLIGQHGEERFSASWERLGICALGVMEGFMRVCPETAATEAARMIVGEQAFITWRGLPRGFAPEYRRRLLAIWRAAPHRRRMELGGTVFRALARGLGYVGAGAVLRLRNRPFADIRTIPDDEIARLLRN